MAKTRYVVRPNPRLQKLQRDIRKQFGTYKSTYLAKVDGAIRLPGGYFWVHDANGVDANGNTTYGAPRKLLMLPGAAIFPRPNTKVDVVTIHGVDYIARTNSHELERMGVDPHQSNTLDPVVQYKALDFIINLQAFKTPGASSTHIIGSVYKKPDGYYDVLPTTGGYDFVTANIPSTDNQVVVCQWVNTDDNTVSATVSSEVSRDIDLKHPDNLTDVLTLINECVDSAPANHIGVNAWRIYDDTTIATLDDNNKLADLRGIIGAGGGSFTLAGDSGTPQTVSTGDTLTVSGGVGLASVASATDTLTLNLDVNSLTADASPDGAADYVATWDASAGTHKKVLLDDLPGGAGGGANTALSNLASVAVNTSLISDTDSTDDLGSTAAFWRNGYIDTMYLTEQSAPSTPASGSGVLYPKTDGKLYWKDDAGTEYDLTAGSGSAPTYPKRWTCWHDEATVLTGNAITGDNTAGNFFYSRFYQNASAINDEFTHGVYLAAGTYTFTALGNTSNNSGKIDWYLDGSTFTTAQDWYSASSVVSVKKTASVVIATDGWHTLKGKVAGKNASSSNYFMVLIKYWFKQSSD